MNQLRVLQVVTHMERGGLESMLINYYRYIDREKIQFDFLVHRQERAAYDDEIEAMGGKIYRLPRLVPWSKAYLTALNRFFDEHPEYRIVHVHQDLKGCAAAQYPGTNCPQPQRKSRQESKISHQALVSAQHPPLCHTPFCLRQGCWGLDVRRRIISDYQQRN